MTCEPGDVFDWSDACLNGGYDYIGQYSRGPFLVLKVIHKKHASGMYNPGVMVRCLATGKTYDWSNPCHWGKKNEFLSAAYKATMSKHKHFKVGDVIRLNPANESYGHWSDLHTAGPFMVMPPIGMTGQIKRLSDGKIIDCSIDVTSWWAILDPFLDAAHKANQPDGTL